MKLIDITGQTFSRLTVIERAKISTLGRAKWLCRCSCSGVEIAVDGHYLRRGHTKSCGCLRRESYNVTHGMTGHPMYTSWYHMKERCYSQTCPDYPNWGGRGIKICREWLDDPAKFMQWSVANGWAPGLTIDRLDNNDDYTPDNCAWKTLKQQQRNKSTNHFVEFNGRSLTIAEWSEITGIGRSTIWSRLKHGWSVDKTMTVPVGNTGPKVNHG